MSKEMEEKKTYTVGEICKMLDISPKVAYAQHFGDFAYRIGFLLFGSIAFRCHNFPFREKGHQTTA